MVWRAITIIFAHIATLLLVGAGLSWIYEGYGLNPLIAFPAAILIYVLNLLWILYEAQSIDVRIQDYLEYLDQRFQLLKEIEDAIKAGKITSNSSVWEEHVDNLYIQLERSQNELQYAKDWFK